MWASRAHALGLAMLILFFGVAVPLLNQLASPTSVQHVPDYVITVLGKFFCYSLLALSLDFIWGYAGILSLGQGAFFALGGYGMGMYLMRTTSGEGIYRSTLPDFMVFLDWQDLPWFWHGFQDFRYAFLMALAVPGFLAFAFGLFAFRSRITGVYFSIITQALTYALMLLCFRNETGLGGNNGLTDFKKIIGYSLQQPNVRLILYLISAAALLFGYLFFRVLVRTKFGRILTAIRDGEKRAMFCGYNTVNYKLCAWTIAAVSSGLAGALYVPQVGIINPSEMAPAFSIEMAIWVAVGGRGTLIGPILGAALVNGAKSWLTVAYPELWLLFLGAVFIIVTLYLPQGVIGFGRRFLSARQQ